MEEPSVLDYVKAKLTPWRGPAPKIPPLPAAPVVPTQPSGDEPSSLTGASGAQIISRSPAAVYAAPEAASASQAAAPTITLPWRAMLAFFLALAGQLMLEPRPDRGWGAGAAFYALAAVFLVWAIWRGEWAAASIPTQERSGQSVVVRWLYIEIGAFMAAVAFWLFGGNRFNLFNLFFWLAALFLILRGLWAARSRSNVPHSGVPGQPPAPQVPAKGGGWHEAGVGVDAGAIERAIEDAEGIDRTHSSEDAGVISLASEDAGAIERTIEDAGGIDEAGEDAGPTGGWPGRLAGFLRKPAWQITITRWTLAVLAVAALVVYFRIYRLDQVPPEMVSDQAEKLWDVWDLLHGQTKIFFERNTGREGLQMYLTAAVIRWLGTGYSFLSLKIGTTLMGLITLVYIYLIGKEMGSRRVGLLAAALAGIAYWPNVITRVALRFALYPAFAAPTLYYLIRGIRRGNRNDFLLAGLFLGLGLHGYSPFRIMPFVVVATVLLYLLHKQSQGNRRWALAGLGSLALVSFTVFLPLVRFWYDQPDLFNYRAMTRMGSVEQPLAGPPLQIFLSNLGKALVMFFWDNGEVWTISIPHRPALDAISAALFFLGVGLFLVRYLKQRHWLDLFWLVSIPMLLLPSVMSLAFPSENPILNRTAGAIIPVFLLAATALDGLMKAIQARVDPAWGPRLAWGTAILLIAWSAQLNYDLVFVEYQRAYELSAWNTSEMGRVIREFADTTGSAETAWVMGYPYWVDTRLVGINAGLPNRDTVMFVQGLPETKVDPRAKLFLINPQDQEAIDALHQIYPQGSLSIYNSRVETKDFLMYFVPPVEQAPGNSG